MWFNYKIPRPCKRGAYQFAHELDVPVISCFVKIIDTDITDNNEFNAVKYRVIINKVIYPEANESIKSDSIKMAEVDYEARKKAYENANDGDPANDHLIPQPYFTVRNQPERIRTFRNQVRQNIDNTRNSVNSTQS